MQSDTAMRNYSGGPNHPFPCVPHHQAVPLRSHLAQPGKDQKQAIVRRSHPAQPGEGFDAPPTLERSGSDHRVGRFPPSLLRREGRGERWSPL